MKAPFINIFIIAVILIEAVFSFGSDMGAAEINSQDSPKYNTEKAIRRVETKEKVVALTFDADMMSKSYEAFKKGKDPLLYNEELISYLKNNNIPATLFLTGYWIEAYPETVKELAQNPLFEVANHSYSHPSFIKRCFRMRPVSDNQDEQEIKKTEELLEKYAPNYKKYFRFPGLCYDKKDFKIAKSLGYLVVHGDVPDGDGIGKGVKFTVKRVLSLVRPGSIVVLHMQGGYTAPSTAKAVPKIVEKLKGKGYRFVKVSELLAL